MNTTIILAGAAGALALTLDDDGRPTGGPTPSPVPVRSGGTTIGQQVSQGAGAAPTTTRPRIGSRIDRSGVERPTGVLAGRPATPARLPPSPPGATATGGSQGNPNPAVSPGAGNYFTGDAGVAQQVMNEAERRAQEEYERLTDEAKKKGAEAINQELGTNLTGDESFEEASAEIGAAIGGVAAAAGCTAIYGAGAAIAPLCAIVGAIVGKYLGEELGPYLRDAYNEVVGWVEDAGEWVSDTAEDAWDWIW